MNFWMISVIWLLFSMLVLNIFGQLGEVMPVRTFIVRVLVKFLIMIAFPVVLASEVLWDVYRTGFTETGRPEKASYFFSQEKQAA